MIVYTHVVHMIISYETTHDALMIMYTHVVHMTTSYETTHDALMIVCTHVVHMTTSYENPIPMSKSCANVPLCLRLCAGTASRGKRLTRS